MNPSNYYQDFIQRGIILHHPETMTLDLAPEQIGQGTEIFPGSRLAGEQTSIAPGCRIGEETPATLVNCQFGRKVIFSGGYANEAVLLDGASCGSGAHLRPGTLMEEKASCAHTVGLKQTLLMPFVTLGSLINFCDVLIAGGTGPDNHSEVGSSCVHFNFTPHQDKATPSLLGDVPHGVMLDQPPVFIGGQGGLVGPVRIAYGTVQAAGCIGRRDVLEEGLLVFGQTGGRQKASPYQHRQYGDIDRIVRNNMIYIGNLHALTAWYKYIRPLLTPADPFAQACLSGAQHLLQKAVQERLHRLQEMTKKIERQATILPSHQRLRTLCPQLPERLLSPETKTAPPPELLLQSIRNQTNKFYIETIQSLSPDAKQAGSNWLQGMVDRTAAIWEKTSP